MALNKYLLCARVVGTHGVKGNLRLESFCDSPAVLAELDTVYLRTTTGTYKQFKVEKASIQKQAVLAKLESVDTLEDAMLWKGRELYADRCDFDLGEDGYFVADQIGLPVLDADSRERYGTVREVLTDRIQDIYVIDDVRGGTFMLPSVPDFVKRVVVEGGEAGIYVKLIEGMRE